MGDFTHTKVYGKLPGGPKKKFKDRSLLTMLSGVGAADKVLKAKAVDRREKNRKQDGKRGAAEAGLDTNTLYQMDRPLSKILTRTSTRRLSET